MDAVLLEQLWEQSRGRNGCISPRDYWKKDAAFMEGVLAPLSGEVWWRI